MGPGAPSHALLSSPEPQTHQFCSSSSSRRNPSSSSRILRRAGKPPCHRPRLKGYPLTRAAPSPLTLRITGIEPGPDACPEGEVGRDALPTPQEASLPPGLIVSGKGGGLDRAGAPHPVPPALPARCSAAETLERLPTAAGWAGPFRPSREGRGVDTPTQKGPSQHQEGKGDLLRAPLSTASETPGVLGAGNPGDVACCTEKGARGGGRVQAAPHDIVTSVGDPRGVGGGSPGSLLPS